MSIMSITSIMSKMNGELFPTTGQRWQRELNEMIYLKLPPEVRILFFNSPLNIVGLD